MKTYFGTRVPAPGSVDVDTASDTLVCVFTREMRSDGQVDVGLPSHLTHACRATSAPFAYSIRESQWAARFPCHSPTGFNWGYEGSGPAELAAMILFDLDLPLEQVWALHQAFKSQFVARFGDVWVLHEEQIRSWLSHAGRSHALSLVATTNEPFEDDEDPDAINTELGGGLLPGNTDYPHHEAPERESTAFRTPGFGGWWSVGGRQA